MKVDCAPAIWISPAHHCALCAKGGRCIGLFVSVKGAAKSIHLFSASFRPSLPLTDKVARFEDVTVPVIDNISTKKNFSKVHEYEADLETFP